MRFTIIRVDPTGKEHEIDTVEAGTLEAATLQGLVTWIQSNNGARSYDYLIAKPIVN